MLQERLLGILPLFSKLCRRFLVVNVAIQQRSLISKREEHAILEHAASAHPPPSDHAVKGKSLLLMLLKQTMMMVVARFIVAAIDQVIIAAVITESQMHDTPKQIVLGMSGSFGAASQQSIFQLLRRRSVP